MGAGDDASEQCGPADARDAARFEARFRAVFESSRDAISISRAGVLLFANEACRVLFGYPPGSAVPNARVIDLIAPARREELLQLMSRRARGMPAPTTYLTRGLRADGTAFDMEVTVSVYQEAGEPLTLAILRDVTVQKRTEQESAERAAELREIMDTAGVGIGQVDRAGRITHANRGFAEMFGYPKSELVGMEYVELVHPSERETGRASMLSLLASQVEAVELERRYVRKDGTAFWGQLSCRRMRDAGGGEIGLIGVITDVTKRREAEESLRASEVRFRAIIEHAAAGIIVADVETRAIRYVNPEICRLLGYEQGELLALKATDLAVPEEEAVSAAGFQAHADGRTSRTERTFRRKDGSPARMSVTSVRMELDGRPCVVGFFTDVSVQRLLDEERLKTERLESLGTLAGGIAHDFNNLLQGVFGYISMAKLSLEAKEKASALLENAERALHRSVGLTSQLLTFSRGGKPQKKVFALGPVVEEASRFALSGSRVVPVLAITADLNAVDADPGQISQVIQNIVLNADQAMPLGGKIEIGARNVSASGVPGLPADVPEQLVEVTVRDGGIGIPPEHLARIFDPYFTTKEKGSGLGLATSYSIVRNHGGAIVVSSEMGKGTTIRVYLPATRAAQVSPAARPQAPEMRRGRVLVMDDHELVRTVAAQLVRALGHEAETAENGEEAIEKYLAAKAAGRPFDVVILDLTVPGGIGGAEALQRLREVDPDVKAVVSSGYSEDGAVADYRAKGFRALLTKPYAVERLRAVLGELLR